MRKCRKPPSVSPPTPAQLTLLLLRQDTKPASLPPGNTVFLQLLIYGEIMCIRSSERLAAAQKIFNISSSSSHLCLMSSPNFPFPRGRGDRLVFLWLRFSPNAAARSSCSSSTSSRPSFAAHLYPLFLMYIRPELGFVLHVQPELTEICNCGRQQMSEEQESEVLSTHLSLKIKIFRFQSIMFQPFYSMLSEVTCVSRVLAPDILNFHHPKKAPMQP